MKMSCHHFASFVLISLLMFSGAGAIAQGKPAERSSQAAAVSDVQYIAVNIEYNKGVMFLAQKAKERGADSRVKELAQQMVEDHSAMLYAMEQLKAAGSGSIGGSTASGNTVTAIATINGQISAARADIFDSVWVANLLNLQQSKFDEFTQAKLTVTNTQLKAAISDALPLIRKQLTELRSIQKYLQRMAIQQEKEARQKEKEARLNEKNSRRQ